MFSFFLDSLILSINLHYHSLLKGLDDKRPIISPIRLLFIIKSLFAREFACWITLVNTPQRFAFTKEGYSKLVRPWPMQNWKGKIEVKYKCRIIDVFPIHCLPYACCSCNVMPRLCKCNVYGRTFPEGNPAGAGLQPCVCFVTNFRNLETIQNQNVQQPFSICKIIHGTAVNPMPWLIYKAGGYRVPVQVI